MATGFTMVEILEQQRDTGDTTPSQVAWMVEEFCAGRVEQAQIGAWLMAVCCTGLSKESAAALTAAYVASGSRLSWDALDRPVVDKHSTGGVGDKVSLPLAPLLAACGLAVPMCSGRGLGHTGGTLDKLEALSGVRTTLSVPELRRQIEAVGVAICAASDELAPADRAIYAIRDTTGTVPSIPLIAASIMSKKIAADVGHLLLDVKVGRGAFMQTIDDAHRLAAAMCVIGAANGVETVAYCTSMDAPIGYTAGNAIEVVESLATLRGEGPSDLTTLVRTFAVELVAAAHPSAKSATDPVAAAADIVDNAWSSGRAVAAFEAMIAAQGGSVPFELPTPVATLVVPATATGVLLEMDALAVGRAAWVLGAGRTTPGAPVDPAAGVRWFHKPGDAVAAGTPLFELSTSNPTNLDRAAATLANATVCAPSGTFVVREPLVRDRLTAADA